MTPSKVLLDRTFAASRALYSDARAKAGLWSLPVISRPESIMHSIGSALIMTPSECNFIQVVLCFVLYCTVPYCTVALSCSACTSHLPCFDTALACRLNGSHEKVRKFHSRTNV